MAKKKFNDNLNDILGTSEKKKTTSTDRLADGDTRHTFIVAISHLMDMKAIAKKENKTIKATMNEALKRFAADYREKKGDFNPDEILKDKPIL